MEKNKIELVKKQGATSLMKECIVANLRDVSGTLDKTFETVESKSPDKFFTCIESMQTLLTDAHDYMIEIQKINME